MPLVSTRSLVLQAFSYSDTSKILRLFTLEYGARSVIAKGALRPKSRFGGLLEPFTEGDALLYLREGRDLHTLGGFDLIRSRQELGRDLAAFAGASLIAELLLRFGTEEPNPSLYRVASESFDAIGTAPDHERTCRAAVAAVWLVVSLLGYRPETDHCVTCGREIQPSEPARFDPEAGGAACVHCRPHGRALDSESRGELRRMVRGEALRAPFARGAVQHALLRAFLSAHLGQDRQLHSLNLFTEHLS